MAEKRKLRFIEDPGHGWLEVDRADLIFLFIDGQITSSSYQGRDDKVYLEEDIDAGIFMDAAKKEGWDVTIENVHQETTFIRGLRSYESNS